MKYRDSWREQFASNEQKTFSLTEDTKKVHTLPCSAAHYATYFQFRKLNIPN